MEIYGLGLVGICMFLGSFIGRLIGKAVNINGDVGGVGFAILILILYTNYLEKKGRPLSEKTSNGIGLLNSLFIPIVVAMSMIQNVVAAFEGGLVPLLGGLLATMGGILLVPVMLKFVKEENK